MTQRPKFAKSSVDTEASNGEITFIAARNVRNLNGFEYETSTLLAQDATGEYSTLSSEWQDVAIPLMQNHSGDVNEKIGNIYTARLVASGEEQHVEMKAKFFKGDLAQEVRQRVLDGELTDVSITTDWGSGYTEEDEFDVLKNAHIIEVSVVYAGAEPKAKILASNSVDTEEESVEEEAETNELEEAQKRIAELEAENEALKAEDETEEEVESEDEAEAEVESDKEETNNSEEEEEMATQTTNPPAENAVELTKAQVLNSFAKLVENGTLRGKMTQNDIKKAITNDVTITDGGNGTYVVPDAVWTEILMAKRDTDILDTFKTTSVRRKTILAEERSEADLARAGKYTKGELKVIQELKLVPQKLNTQFLYKLQKLDYEDLEEDFGGTLYSAVKEELPQKISEEEERDFIVGDGRLVSNNRHITSIVSLDAAAESSANINVYKYDGSGDASAVTAVMNGIAKLGEDGTRYAVMSLTTLTAMRQAGLATAAGLPFSVETVAGAIGVDKIFTREYVAANVVYVWTGGLVERLTGSVDEIEQYDIDYNQRKIEALRRVGGSATGLYSAVKVTLPGVISA